MIHEMSICERRALHAHSQEIYRLLRMVAKELPRGYAQIGKMLDSIENAVSGEGDAPVLHEIGYSLLKLAFPILSLLDSEACVETRDQIELFFVTVEKGCP